MFFRQLVRELERIRRDLSMLRATWSEMHPKLSCGNVTLQSLVLFEHRLRKTRRKVQIARRLVSTVTVNAGDEANDLRRVLRILLKELDDLFKGPGFGEGSLITQVGEIKRDYTGVYTGLQTPPDTVGVITVPRAQLENSTSAACLLAAVVVVEVSLRLTAVIRKRFA